MAHEGQSLRVCDTPYKQQAYLQVVPWCCTEGKDSEPTSSVGELLHNLHVTQCRDNTKERT